MNSQKTTSLFKLTALYSIGNLSSKVISFVLVFFTTFYLTKESVGEFDLILITLSLLSPFVTLQLTDSALRWLLDNDAEDVSKKVFSTISTVLVISNFLFLGLIIIYDYFFTVKYVVLLCVLLFTQSFYLFFLQCIRGLKKNKMYVLVGLINTFIYVALSILSLAIFKLKVEGLLYANILATIITSLILLINGKLFTLWSNQKVSLDFAKTLLHYSIPLIPNSLSWWAISSANRYIIVLYLGIAANGVFAIAYKLPTILLMFVNIFYLAWQEKSILAYEREDRDAYYSKILKKYIYILFSLSILIVATNKIVLRFIVSKDFFEAWQYTPLLLLSIILSSISGFYGTGYLSVKKTRGAFTSSFFGGLTTVLLSILLVPNFGLYGASIAIVMGYLVLLIIRIIHMKDIFKINFPLRIVLFLTFFLFLVSILNYGNTYVLFFNVLFGFAIVIYINRKELRNLETLIRNKLKK